MIRLHILISIRPDIMCKSLPERDAVSPRVMHAIFTTTPSRYKAVEVHTKATIIRCSRGVLYTYIYIPL